MSGELVDLMMKWDAAKDVLARLIDAPAAEYNAQLARCRAIRRAMEDLIPASTTDESETLRVAHIA